MFIENVLGFKKVSAAGKEVRWRLKKNKGRHGIRNLRFGDIVTDIVFDGKGTVSVTSNASYSLIINGNTYSVRKGDTEIKL
ncbi:MAG: hypothetical protein EGQ21_00185 [Akkermansia sp.]|nr:hypothetical protein [Akkermansia sp.]